VADLLEDMTGDGDRVFLEGLDEVLQSMGFFALPLPLEGAVGNKIKKVFRKKIGNRRCTSNYLDGAFFIGNFLSFGTLEGSSFERFS
jgi:hypothetical protein